MADAVNLIEEREEQSLGVLYDTRPRPLSRWQRLQLPAVSWAAYWLVRTIGPTLRFESIGWQHAQRIYARGRRCIFTFWHRSTFSIMWWARHRSIVVLNSTNFDGQWTRRVIERLGYLTAQGSSTRGGLRGLAIMARRMEEGLDVALTIDGPRGPRYVAKPGPVLLARRTGHLIVPFHVGLESACTLNTWDLFQIPYPFSRALIAWHWPIEVPPDADREAVDRKHAEMQAALERARDVAEAWFQMSPQERERERALWNA